MKRTGTLLLALFLGVCFASHCEATVYYSDGSAANVQALHNAALDGDTITIPAGTFTWSTPVTISKAIKLQGAGSGRIIGWSRSSQSFGTGTKTFTVQTGFTADIGTTLRIWQTATDKETAYMLGTVASVSGTTLTMNIVSNTGSGSAPLWLIATEFSTRIVHNAGSSVLIPINENANGSPEVSNIQFTSAPVTTGALIQLNYLSGGQPVLIHDCWFYQTVPQDCIRTYSTNRGVIWNCSVAWSYFAESNSIFLHLPVNNRTEVWSMPSTMGMADTDGKHNFYVEDCDFHGGASAVDCDSNAKLVWRNCVMDHSSLNSHGYDTSAFGNRHWEVYDNSFLFANVGAASLNLQYHCKFRGGTGVITDNYMEDINSQAWGNKPEIVFGIYALGRWSQSPGAYDADDGCVPHYPAPRQMGYGYVTGLGVDGHGETTSNGVYVGDLEPAYVWNNTGFTPVISITTDGTGCTLNQYGHVPDYPQDYIQQGREFFVDIPKPGYSQYTYPHPLRGGPTPTPTPTATPTPAPTPAPTPTPTPTPTSTPSPVPDCMVPNFMGAKMNQAQSIWNAAGFIPPSSVTTRGANGRPIAWQSLPAGSFGACADTAVAVQSR